MNCPQCWKESQNGAELCVKCGERLLDLSATKNEDVNVPSAVSLGSKSVSSTSPVSDHAALQPSVNLRKRRPKRVYFAVSIMVVVAFMILGNSFIFSKNRVAKGEGDSNVRDIGDWIARVNGENVSVDNFDKRLAQAKITFEQKRIDFSTEQGKHLLDAARKQIIDDLVTELLILQDAKAQNLLPDEVEVQTEIIKMQRNFVTADGKFDEAKFRESFNGQGMTVEEFRASMTTIIATQAVFDKAIDALTVSDTDVQAYYEQNKESFSDPEKVKARHILLRSEDEAQAVIAQLMSGASFTELAKEKSTSPGAKDSGGDLGYFSKGEFLAGFEKAAFEQKVGTFSQQPVKTPLGFHVILVEDHKPMVLKLFDQVKEQIKQTLLQTKKDETIKEYLDGLKKKAKIEYAS